MIMFRLICLVILFLLLLTLQSSCTCVKGTLGVPDVDLYNFTVNSFNCTNRSVNISYSYHGPSTVKVKVVLSDKDANILTSQHSSRRTIPNVVYTIELVPRPGMPDIYTAELFNQFAYRLYHCVINFSICYTHAPTQAATGKFNIESTTALYTNSSSALYANSFSELEASQYPIAVYVTVPVFIVLCIILVLLFIKLGRRNAKKLQTDNIDQTTSVEQENSDSENALSKFDLKFVQKSQELLSKSKKSTKLYIVFINDHRKHREVVLNFVNFLQADLGFEVFCELFETEKVSIDPFNWMDNCLKQADKVIVIWSPGAARRWESSSSSENVKHDLFTPALKQIRNNLFRGLNIGKYYFGFFDYCTKESIPDVFTEPNVFHFRLMQEFDDLYFRLKGIEKYIPGGEIKEEKVMFDCYFDTSLNAHGRALHKSISTMTALAKENPNWYLCDDVSLENESMPTEASDCADAMQICHLNIHPPPPLVKNYDLERKFDEVESRKHKNTNEATSDREKPASLIQPKEIGVRFNVGKDMSPKNVPLQPPSKLNAQNKAELLPIATNPHVERSEVLPEKTDAIVVVSKLVDEVNFRHDESRSYTNNSCLNRNKLIPLTENDLVKNQVNSKSEFFQTPKDFQNKNHDESKTQDSKLDETIHFAKKENNKIHLINESNAGLPSTNTNKHMYQNRIELASLDTNTQPMISLLKINAMNNHG